VRTFVYVDGFNLYYGSLKGTAHRWLDLFALAKALMPHASVASVRFFTAKVHGRDDPNRPTRQETYWKALRATGVEVVEGHFLEHAVSMRAVTPPPPTVRVWKTEEKGSDVNLASYLVRDAFTARFEQALVLSNDSDLAAPVRMVRDEAKLPIRVGFPFRTPTESGAFSSREPRATSATFARRRSPPASSRIRSSVAPSPLTNRVRGEHRAIAMVTE
jgi:hypothetical protein